MAQLLDGGELELLLAAGGAVGLGEDEGDFVAGVDEGLEAGDGEFGGSAEDEFHVRVSLVHVEEEVVVAKGLILKALPSLRSERGAKQEADSQRE